MVQNETNILSRATVVCCYNNTQLFEVLVSNLKRQDEEVEIIGIDNTERQYSSCAKAFNTVIDCIKTQYVIFSHQDIRIADKKDIGQFIDYMETLTDEDVLGVAGCGILDRAIHSNIMQEDGKKVGSKEISSIEECFTFDECFFGGHTAYFRNNPFDEIICDGFHLYAAEQCLRARKEGGKAYICGIGLNHLSGGKKENSLNEAFKQLCRKYHGDYRYIYTTCCRGHTGLLIRNIEFLLRGMKYLVVKS